MLLPKLFTTLQGYTRRQFQADLTAGIVVGIVALPLAIAFAIASGVSPERGLYTAIIAGFLISALGGSRVQIGGPTGAFVVIVAGMGALAILLLWPRISRRIPAPFIVLLAATAGAALLDLPLETIGSRFGTLDFSFPRPSLPPLNEALVVQMVGPAITIALLGAIESLLSAVVADGMIGGRHRSNMELVAQGLANVASPLFGGIPATGAIARTATNVKNGGRTPVAGMVHAVVLLFITLFAGRWAARIPMAALAAILLVVAYNMSEWRTFRAEVQTAPRSDTIVMLTTFFLTVLVDLTVALAVGMVLAAFLFMKRMAETSNVQTISREMLDREDQGEERDEAAVQKWRSLVPRGVEVFDVNGPFFFGAAETFSEYLGQVSRKPKAIVLDLEGVPALDSTGLRVLTTLVARRTKEGIPVFVVGLQDQPRDLIRRSSLADLLGRERLDLSAEEAVETIRNYGLVATSREQPSPPPPPFTKSED